MTDDDMRLLFQRQSGRLNQAETWLGILIAHYGQSIIGGGAQLVLDEAQAQQARAMLGDNRMPAISIDYNLETGIYTLDAL